MDPSPPLISSKPTPFKRLKAHLEKRHRSSEEKGKAVEHTPPQTPQINATPLTLESTPQSTETTTVAELSQNAGSCGYGTHSTAGANGSSQKISGENDACSPNADEDSQRISTTALARRIHSLLSPFPSHYTLTPSGSFLPQKTSVQAGEAADSANADSTFLSHLSSISAMNGSIAKGRESVWAALERLRYLPHPHSKEERRDHGEEITRDHEAEPDNVDMSSVMICGPLQPTEETELEIARSEVVSIDFEETLHEPAPVEQPKEQGVGMIRWPFGKEQRRGETVPLAEKALPSPPPQTKEVRVWYPSRTKISLQAFWWGYRMSIVLHVSCST